MCMIQKSGGQDGEVRKKKFKKLSKEGNLALQVYGVVEKVEDAVGALQYGGRIERRRNQEDVTDL